MPQLMTVGEILVEMMADQVGQTFLSPGCIHGPYPSGAPAIMIDQAARMGAEKGPSSTVIPSMAVRKVVWRQ